MSGLMSSPMANELPAVQLKNVDVVRSGRKLLSDISWTIEAHERWVLFGPNGCGKTTLLQVVSSYLFPTRGAVTVLGVTLGESDVRELRKRIGYVGPTPAHLVREGYDCLEIVVTGKHASFVDTRWHTYEEADFKRAIYLLESLGAGAFVHRTFDTMSEGEKKRILIARALMAQPELLLLDEPNAGLDLGARERLVGSLDDLGRDAGIPMVLVTHHVDDIPGSFTHIIMLNNGEVIASGEIKETLTSQAVSDTFDMSLVVSFEGGRFRATAPHS